MNTGIIILEDGSPCIVCDERLEGVAVGVELSRETYLVTLVCEIPVAPEKDDPFLARARTGIQKLSRIARKQAPQQKRLTLEYPMEVRFFKLLEEIKAVGVALSIKGKLESLRLVPVTITNT